MRKMLLVLALFLSGGLKAATNTPTPTSTIAPVTGGIYDSSIEYLPNVGIGLRRVIITDSRGTPIGTATPGQIVVTNTPTITQTPTPVTNTLTPTSTFTPAQVIPVTVTGTVTPPAYTCANCTPPPTQIPLATPGGAVVDTGVLAAVNYQVSAIPTPQVRGYATTALPTAVSQGAAIPPSMDLFGNQRVSVFSAGGTGISIATAADGTSNVQALKTQNLTMNWNGASWDFNRGATTFNSLTITASGSTAIIGPNTNGGNSPLLSGNKWRLLGWSVSFTGDATDASADLIVSFKDNTTVMGPQQSFNIPAVAFTNVIGFTSPWLPLGNGIASSTANNALNVVLSSALTAGYCIVNVAFIQGTTP